MPFQLLPAFILGLIFWGAVFGKFGSMGIWVALFALLGIIIIFGHRGYLAAERAKRWKYLNACTKCRSGTSTIAKHCQYCGAKLPPTDKPRLESHIAEEESRVISAGGRCTGLYHVICLAHGHTFCMMCGKNLGDE